MLCGVARVDAYDTVAKHSKSQVAPMPTRRLDLTRWTNFNTSTSATALIEEGAQEIYSYNTVTYTSGSVPEYSMSIKTRMPEYRRVSHSESASGAGNTGAILQESRRTR